MSQSEGEPLQISFSSSSADCVAHLLHRGLHLAIFYQSKLAPVEFPKPNSRLLSGFPAALGRNLRRDLRGFRIEFELTLEKWFGRFEAASFG